MNREIINTVCELMESKTFQSVIMAAKFCPIDTTNNEHFKDCLATSCFDLIKAQDSGTIEFSNEDDAAMFFAMLALCMKFILGEHIKGIANKVIN